MNVWRILKKLSFSTLWRLSKPFLKNPELVIPTCKATKQTIRICEDLFGDKHHQHGIENAIRHALWNIAICQQIYKKKKSVTFSVSWAELITNAHEEIFPNAPLEKAMDLHNNYVGRLEYEKNPDISLEMALMNLKRMESKAKHLHSLNELKDVKAELLFIEKT